MGLSTQTVQQDEFQLASERKRIRELFKYFRAASPAIEIIDPDSQTSYDPTLARLASDPALTAFAQLGALRLDCDRSFISLIDSHEQHIIAEASRSISLYSADRHQQGDALCLGARPLDLFAGVCAGTMKVFTSQDDRYNISTSNIFADHSQYVINDFTQEEMYKDRPYVTDFPQMRFYAEVPLKSPSGYVLGSYCVVDNKPRAGLDDDGFLVLTEIASTIMKHLDLVKLKEEHARAEGLLQGLNYFVQGKTGLHQGSPGHSAVERANELRGLIREEWINAQVEPQWQISDGEPGPLTRDNFLSQSEVDGGGVASSISSTSEQDASVHTSTTRPVTPLRSESQPSNLDSENMDLPTDPERTEATAKGSFEGPQGKMKEEDVGTRLRELAISDDIRENFSEASTLLRQAMDLDGVVFLDASSSKFGSYGAMNESRHSSVPSADISQSPSGDEGQESTGDAQIVDARSNDRKWGTGNEQNGKHEVVKSDPESIMSGRLGFSTLQKSSLTGNSLAYNRFSLPEDIHQSLLKRYPRGHVFNFDGTGPLSSSGEESLVVLQQEKSNISTSRKASQSPKRVIKRREEEAAIRQCFPGVRSLIFVPLWNPHKEGWFAGSLGWTTEEKRVLQSREFAYFSAFGNSVMAEVTRLELLATDRAKSDFISSVSHELRSPLHGILGSAELLREMSTLPDQYEMIDMIENCGRTLLETMDHLLDFAKINNITRSKRPKKKDNIDSSLVPRNGGTPESKLSFDLSVLIEDLVEGVLAGYRFNHRSLGSLSGNNNAGNHTYARLIQESPSVHAVDVHQMPLSVILSIDERSTWQIRSEAGAWRRILVNLLSNAMKYTTSGFVEVALRYAETIRTTTHSKTQTMVTVTISDTGCGIGKDYLQHHLYTPFAQENTLAVGTGLGLSIVKQITSSLYGSIDIQSEVGTGTKVAVSIPVDFAPSPTTNGISTQYNNLTLCLLAFDVYPELATAPTGILSASSKLAVAMKTALATEAEQWFGLRVVSAQDASSIDANIIAVTEDKLDILQVDDGAGGRVLQLPPRSSLIVLCSNVLADNQSKWKGLRRVECLTQPFGPRKMAKALAACLQHQDDDSTIPLALPSRFMPKDVEHEETITPTEISNFGRLPEKAPEFHLPAPSVLSRVSDEKSDNLIPTVTLPKFLHRPYLLLVDDNAINLKMLVTHTRKMNCEYATAVNGLHALEIYRETTRPFDYVLMDVSMPVMDGFTATREIRAHEKANNLPAATVVALTGLGSAKAQQEAFTSGVNLFLTKPVPLKKLKALIDNGAVMDDP